MYISKFKFPNTKYSNENLNAKSSIRNTHSFDYALLIEGGIYIKNNYFIPTIPTLTQKNMKTKGLNSVSSYLLKLIRKLFNFQ